MFSRHFCCKCNVSVVVCLCVETCCYVMRDVLLLWYLPAFYEKWTTFCVLCFVVVINIVLSSHTHIYVYRASHVVNGTREWIRPLCHEWNLCISLNETLILHSWERAEWMCTFRSNEWIWVFYINIRCIWETTFSWAVTLKSVGTAPFTSHWLSIRINIPQEQVFVLYLA